MGLGSREGNGRRLPVRGGSRAVRAGPAPRRGGRVGSPIYSGPPRPGASGTGRPLGGGPRAGARGRGFVNALLPGRWRLRAGPKRPRAKPPAAREEATLHAGWPAARRRRQAASPTPPSPSPASSTAEGSATVGGFRVTTAPMLPLLLAVGGPGATKHSSLTA